MKKNFAAGLLALCCAASAGAEVNRLVVEPNAKGAEIPSTLYGLFFEDINYGADGGLYAEKVKNRSFDFTYPLTGWTAFGKVEVLNEGGPFEKNPNYIRLNPSGHRDKHSGVDNEGFFGVSFEKGENYNFSLWARVPDGGSSKIRVELIDPSTMGESQNMGSKEIEVSGKEWKKYNVTLTPSQTVYKGKLRVFLLRGQGSVDLEHLSLFPEKTWKGRDNGLREDLVQKLADLKPGVFRFPGGCIVEGTDVDTRYQWKNTVGPVENRPVNENRWHYTFTHRFFPDYYQSYGLGFYEYFLLSEDIGAEPLPILNVGLICQYQNNENDQIHMDELQPYIDDALDLIEFANGPADSQWGKLRADMGHPEPFNLKFIGIGNEQWGEIYPQHLEPFIKAIREKYPDIKIVGSSGPNSEGKEFDYLWPEMKRLKADLVDEHFYRPESWFLSQGNRYDNYDRKGPKVFAGEYACHGKGKKYNHFNASLLEAAFMTGIERNADVVEMATYAPLFAHVEGWQWRPDMIWFDNFRSMPTASYYVQQLFSLNKGSKIVPLKMDGKPVAGNKGQNGLFASAVTESPSGDLIVKVVNTGTENQELQIDIKGLKKNQTYNSLEVTTLHAEDDAENTLDNQEIVKPSVKTFSDPNITDMNVTIPAKTFAVYRFKK